MLRSWYCLKVGRIFHSKFWGLSFPQDFQALRFFRLHVTSNITGCA